MPLHSRFFQTNGYHVYYYAAEQATRHNLKGSFDLRDVTDICRAEGASEHSLQLTIRHKYSAFANREEPTFIVDFGKAEKKERWIQLWVSAVMAVNPNHVHTS